MRHAIIFIFGILTSSIVLADSPSPPAQSTPTLTELTPGAWRLDWSGVAVRTYFIQTSSDLVAWQYQPVMAFGDGVWTVPGLGSSSPKYFIRLVCRDGEPVTTLQEARDADFDGDGIPNYYEVENLFSDPLEKNSAGGDSDHDGLADGWELFYFGDLVSADPNAKNTLDGLTNREKSELGLSPHGDDLGLSTERIGYAYDGERLSGVTFYVQREFNYMLDGNGNLEVTTSNP